MLCGTFRTHTSCASRSAPTAGSAGVHDHRPGCVRAVGVRSSRRPSSDWTATTSACAASSRRRSDARPRGVVLLRRLAAAQRHRPHGRLRAARGRLRCGRSRRRPSTASTPRATAPIHRAPVPAAAGGGVTAAARCHEASGAVTDRATADDSPRGASLADVLSASERPCGALMAIVASAGCASGIH